MASPKKREKAGKRPESGPQVLSPVEDVETVEEREVEGSRRRIFWLLGTLLALIGLLIWLLARSSPKPSSPESFSQGGNSPDAVIEKLHLVSTVQGMKRWIMDSDSARMYQSQKQAYADQVFIQYFKKDKLVSTLTADKAVINTETNATVTEGHVELVTENGSKLVTDKLNWDPATDDIRTDSKVHVYKGTDDITAVGMVADTQLNNIRFMRDVHTQVRNTNEVEDYDKPKKF